MIGAPTYGGSCASGKGCSPIDEDAPIRRGPFMTMPKQTRLHLGAIEIYYDG